MSNARYYNQNMKSRTTKDACHGYLPRMLVVPAFSSAISFLILLIFRITDYFFIDTQSPHILVVIYPYLYILFHITVFIFVVSIPVVLIKILLRWFKCKSKGTVK